MNDEEFLGYCEIHSRTDRALFAAGHVQRLATLAGVPHLVDVSRREWWTMRAPEADPLIEMAREKIREKKEVARCATLSAGFIEGETTSW